MPFAKLECRSRLPMPIASSNGFERIFVDVGTCRSANEEDDDDDEADDDEDIEVNFLDCDNNGDDKGIFVCMEWGTNGGSAVDCANADWRCSNGATTIFVCDFSCVPTTGNGQAEKMRGKIVCQASEIG